jgi:hypothetical protein
MRPDSSSSDMSAVVVAPQALNQGRRATMSAFENLRRHRSGNALVADGQRNRRAAHNAAYILRTLIPYLL